MTFETHIDVGLMKFTSFQQQILALPPAPSSGLTVQAQSPGREPKCGFPNWGAPPYTMGFLGDGRALFWLSIVLLDGRVPG